MRQLSIILSLFIGIAATAQVPSVGINTSTPDASTALHINADNLGLLTPSVALTGSNDVSTVINAPYPTGLMIYNSATVNGANAVSPGFYYWNGSLWNRLLAGTEGQDHDWYEVGTTASPDNINDNKYTFGNTGIGIATPLTRLHVLSDLSTDILRIESGAFVNGGVSRLSFMHTDGSNPSNSPRSYIESYLSGGHSTEMRFYTVNDETTNDPTVKMTLKSTGNVGIGTTDPTSNYLLHVQGNVYSNDNFYLNNSSGTGTTPFRIDGSADNLYIIAEGGVGQPATTLRLRTAAAGSTAVDQVIIQSDGDLEMQGNNTIHMGNNVVVMEDRTVQSKAAGGAFGTVSSTSATLRVESGDVVVISVTWRARFADGSGTDDVNYRIVSTGASGCSSITGNQMDFRPPEGTGEHDNFMPYAFMDTFTAGCSGTYTFVLQAQTTGANDALEVDDVVIVATIY